MIQINRKSCNRISRELEELGQSEISLVLLERVMDALKELDKLLISDLLQYTQTSRR